MIQSPAIWLIPYAQLKSTAREAWARDYPSRVMPQIMTVRDWAASLGVLAKAPSDIHFDAGIDRLIAESLIPKSIRRSVGAAGLGSAVQRVLDGAYALAPVLAAIAPNERLAWANARAGLFQAEGVFQLEGSLGFIALMWAAATNYDTDVLWQRRAQLLVACEHFYVTTGLQADALVQALLVGVGDKTSEIAISRFGLGLPASGGIDEYMAADAEDLVQQTAALILKRQTATQGLKPSSSGIALIALDRQITRRVSAVLANRGVRLQDETGWALSTTAVAAQLMAWLAAMERDATSDDVLAAMKTAPLRFPPADVSLLEQRIRRQGFVQWTQVDSEALADWPVRFAKAKTLWEFLRTTKELLVYVGLWDGLVQDAAGAALCKALFVEGAIQSTPLSFANFRQWVRAVLEDSRFRMASSLDAEGAGSTVVTALPLAQSFGRRFDAVVIPGCDARHLPARPVAKGDWSAAQRVALSLPTADDAAKAQSDAWAWLCRQPKTSVLWQRLEGEQELQKSGLLQVLEMAGRLSQKPSLLVQVKIREDSQSETSTTSNVFDEGVPIDWRIHAPTQLTASSYSDLRACPYRFYAKHILGLRALSELDDTIEKRDFGTWLHGTLHRFHEALKHDPMLDRTPLLDACARAEQAAIGLDDAAFLPFQLVWPKTREAYLAWLAGHEAAGMVYVAGEVEKSFVMSIEGKAVRIFGKIDRMDWRMDEGGEQAEQWLLDYKTEALTKTKDRLKDANEDTQLAFYAAVVANHEAMNKVFPIRAAYVNLVERAKEREGTQTVELLDVGLRRDALLAGIESDLSRMAQGHGLRALGDGDTCTYCEVRGLCRTDVGRGRS